MLIADLHERIRHCALATVASGQLSQTALAELVGVQQAHISNFLTGKRGLSIGGMDAVLTALGLDVAGLVAMSDEMGVGKDRSIAFENVPLIQHRAAMNPTFGEDEVFGELRFTKVLLRRLKAQNQETRTHWVRFVTVKAGAAMSAPMHPWLGNGSVLLVDRHYCSLVECRKGEPNLYLVRKEESLMVRWIEMQGTQLSLRPEIGNYPLNFVNIDGKNPLTSCIVGRVAHIATELGGTLQRPPLLLQRQSRAGLSSAVQLARKGDRNP